MPPRKRAPGPRSKRGSRASAELTVPNPVSSDEPYPPATADSEIPTMDNSRSDISPKTAALEVVPLPPPTPPELPELEYRNARLIDSDKTIGEGDDNDKPKVDEVAVPERVQDGIVGSMGVEMAGCEGSEGAEKDWNKESVVMEDSTSVKKRKKVVKVVKKVVKKVVRKKVVRKDRAGNLEGEQEFQTPELSNVEGTLTGNADGGLEEASMEVGSPGLNASVAVAGASATEGDGNVNGTEEGDGKNGDFETEILLGDEKNGLSVSVEEQRGTDGGEIEESGGEKEVSGARIALGGGSDKLGVNDEVTGEETKVGLADGSENFKVGVGNDEGLNQEKEKTVEGSSMEGFEKGSREIALSGELEALERRKRRNTEIFVGGLDRNTKEEDIRKVFKQMGEIIQVRLVIDANSGRNKGFGFVRYASAADARRALEKYEKVEVS